MPSFCTSDGVRISYREAGSGPALLVVPGAFVGARYFDRQLRGLADHFRVVVMDPRGQGDSEKTSRGRWMGRAAFDIHELIRTLGLPEVLLAGWSVGVSSVLAYLDLFGQQQVSAVCLIAGAPRLIIRDDWPHGFLTLPAADEYRASTERKMDETARALVPLFFRQRPPDYDELLEDTLRAGPPDGQAAIAWSAQVEDFIPTLAELSRPLLVVLGRHDSFVPVTNQEVFLAHTPHAHVEVFDNSAHAPFIEEPERFNEAIVSFHRAATVRG